MYRRDFLDACAQFVDELRPRAAPEGNIGEQLLLRFRKLTPIRNLIVDWVLLEGATDPSEEFDEELSQFLERLLSLRGRPQTVNSWTENWYEAHKLFVYETFLYVVAALLKAGAYTSLNSVLMGHYLQTDPDSRRGEHVTFTEFYCYSENLNAALLAEVGDKRDVKYHSEAAELLKRSADRNDISFDNLKETDALIEIASMMRNTNWYPQTHYYWGWGNAAPFFLRSIQRKHFKKLGTVLGVKTGDELRLALKGKKSKVDSFRSNLSVEEFTNLAKLDTIA